MKAAKTENITEEQAQGEFEKYKGRVTEDDVSGILEKEDKIMGKARGPLEKFIEDMSLLFAVIKDYANGSYRKIPWATIAAIVGTLVYIVSPIDLIPDFIPGIGLLDDAAVLAFCLKAVHSDLQNYKTWKESHVPAKTPFPQRLAAWLHGLPRQGM
jgi:uncharacterized membrane protein YkvA (DUF1232 family)